MRTFKYLITIFSLFVLTSCDSDTSAQSTNKNDKENFGSYWYKGKAEISSYHLEQARYGELRQGHSVLIFVTEDFSRSKQVKLDYPSEAGDDRVKVLKLNNTRKFNTGIYPYSMMTSVFTPVDRQSFPHTLKVTTSSQEWCGHSFTQLNKKNIGYQVQQFSYFESEGDIKAQIDQCLLEDELWSLIRIDPDKLPIGEQLLVPSIFYIRFSHSEIKPEKAILSIQDIDNEKKQYVIDYQNINRKLTIIFSEQFPYQILGWEESYKSGFGASAKEMKTTATLHKTLFTDYWNKNKVGDSSYRKELGLPE